MCIVFDYFIPLSIVDNWGKMTLSCMGCFKISFLWGRGQAKQVTFCFSINTNSTLLKVTSFRANPENYESKIRRETCKAR